MILRGDPKPVTPEAMENLDEVCKGLTSFVRL